MCCTSASSALEAGLHFICSSASLDLILNLFYHSLIDAEISSRTGDWDIIVDSIECLFFAAASLISYLTHVSTFMLGNLAPPQILPPLAHLPRLRISSNGIRPTHFIFIIVSSIIFILSSRVLAGKPCQYVIHQRKECYCDWDLVSHTWSCCSDCTLLCETQQESLTRCRRLALSTSVGGLYFQRKMS